MINDYTFLNLTKLDVLDSLDFIKIGKEYKVDGVVLDSFPGTIFELHVADLHILERVEVVYETLPGWKQCISQCKTWDSLPANAKNYIWRIEELVGVKIAWIGVGPGREEMIKMNI